MVEITVIKDLTLKEKSEESKFFTDKKYCVTKILSPYMLYLTHKRNQEAFYNS